jgi:hypothetical protein
MNKKILIPLIRLLIVIHICTQLYHYSSFNLSFSFATPYEIGVTIGSTLGILIILLIPLYYILQGIKETKNENFNSSFLRINAIIWSTIIELIILTNFSFTFELTLESIYYRILLIIWGIVIYTDFRIQFVKKHNSLEDLET